MNITGCATIGTQPNFISDAQLAALSQSVWNEIKAKTKISKDANTRNRIDTIVGKIARVVNIPNASWEYEVFETPEINAFVLPGVKFGIYRGLLDMVQNNAQIVYVLGHEIAHMKTRHTVERIISRNSVLIPFSQNQEIEADILGLGYLKSAGYDPREALKFWEIMQNAQKTHIIEFLSSHPIDDIRISRLKTEIVKMGYQV